MDKQTSISIIDLIVQADVIVKIVMAILAVASIWSWTIIFEKIIKLKIVEIRSNKLESMFEKNVGLDQIYKIAKSTSEHPIAATFLSCMMEWKSNNIKQIMQEDSAKKQSLKDRLYSAMQIGSNRSISDLESGLGFLAIIGSSAPFIGLFGTVWGIMVSFQGIAIAKNTSLAVVAPGIAEALLATGIGLFAAIPGVFFYNIFANKINKISERTNNFSMQILNLLSKELDN